MAQTNEQSIMLPKTHAHIMLTQLKIKEGLKAYGNRGDEAIIKEQTRKTNVICTT